MSNVAEDLSGATKCPTGRCKCKCKCKSVESGTYIPRYSPPDLESIARLLGVSGRRLVDCGGDWRILPRGDRRRRPVMVLSSEDVERLRSEKLIVASPTGYVLAAEGGAPPDEDRPAAGAWVFKAAGVPAKPTRWRGFARLAELARKGRGPLSLRQALAGLRLIEDAENAARDPMLTMNWDGVPTDRQTRGGFSGGFPPHARRAAARVDAIRAALGERDFRLVYAVCVQRANLKEIEHRFGLKRLGSRTALSEVLEKVAEVYDG